eukprot:Blabericola_migrator_1__1338@NODE_1349_length_4754_cov_28_814807_g905_i0_p2_GENE_NODE_1349_length_4754_cov_28_814807_g905_i0NODE_1349_length_4754_cov_28_814807_g905_i0_p2_ORF_typecomplete_len303_score17_91uDENN/PF03456_18/0_24uDENN/PF03456_18/1_1e04_NODE_1349_length_4754_cov_28_814807_g905_i03431251
MVQARRRSRLKPETLISFPGTATMENAGVSLSLMRDRTILERSICEFCFPNGTTVIEADHASRSSNDGALSEEYIYFTLNGSVLSEGDSDCSQHTLYCTALKTAESITIKRLVPELMDIETCINSQNDLSPQAFDERLQLLSFFAASPEHKEAIVTWRLPYCFVLVSKFPLFSWQAAFVRMFRDMCLTSTEHSVLQPLETARPMTKPPSILQIFPLLPWARKTVVPYTLRSVSKMIKAQIECGLADVEMSQLEAFVDLVTDWWATSNKMSCLDSLPSQVHTRPSYHRHKGGSNLGGLVLPHG